MNQSVILFDLDGTLANNEHRQHYVSNGNKKWDLFFAEQSKDIPNKPIVELFHNLKQANKNKIFVVTARPENFREITNKWLSKYEIFPDRILMRKEGDRRSDVIVKKEILNSLRSEGFEPLFVVDDRACVVEMWRNEGITCLQCANHEF